MKLHYISPSTLPSRSANAVHVVMQCNALERAGADVTLYAKRSLPDRARFVGALKEAYGGDSLKLNIVDYYSRNNRGDNLKIAGMALSDMHRGRWPDAILSRNLYASYLIAVIERKPLLFETHQLEYGFRKKMQKAIMVCPWVKTVCISRELVACLKEHHGVAPFRPLVLHDAAPDGIVPLQAGRERRCALSRIVPRARDGWNMVCGYFGHLYPGRGIEVIEKIAEARPDTLFLVFGGNETDVQSKRKQCHLRNLYFAGHVPHPVAQEAMRAVDVLLMPYQKAVSIGVDGHDTARWMSPMKMFEYLASGVPIISSDLPVLREVLKDGRNCLLAEPSATESWLGALDRLSFDSNLASSIGNQGHYDYARGYTWTQRAQRILAAC